MAINELSNVKLKNYHKLLQKKYRDQTNTFMVEGPHLVEEAKNLGVVIEIIIKHPDLKLKFKEALLVNPKDFNKLVNTQHSQGVIAVCKKIIPKPLGNKVLALENIQDPGNLGTLIRTAVCFGYTDVLLSGCDAYNDKVLRASQGAIFKINIFQVKNIIQHFKDKKYQIIGAVVNKKSQSYQVIHPKKPFMLVLGNEGSGLSLDLVKHLDYQVYIPIQFESLNVAIAGAILMNHYQ